MFIVIDTIRKLLLTGFIMFIGIQRGSSQLLRLIVANIVSMIYFGILLAYRPYKRNDDYNLAFLSNLLLTSCFSLGLILKLCDDEESDSETCKTFVGTTFTFETTSILVLVIALSMLLITVGFIAVLTYSNLTTPVVRLVSNGGKPHLELPENCKYHVFASHVWSSGQDRTHSIVRKLQLLMPGIKIWLDVDHLHNISGLEDSVSESAVFMLYYSNLYFRSKNCRREVYAAIKMNKPIILVYEGGQSTLEEMKQECVAGREDDDGDVDGNDIPDAGTIIRKVISSDDYGLSFNSLSNTPIQWLKQGEFSAAALNRLFYRILSNLPYYSKHSIDLSKGIRVPGEIAPISLDFPVDVLTCEHNDGAKDLALELMELDGIDPEKLELHDAVTFLKDWDTNSSTSQNNTDKVDLSQPIMNINRRPAYLLLYLNKFTFDEWESFGQNSTASIIESCINRRIKIILVHEQDEEYGACPFSMFFEQAPSKLYNPPYNLFNELAVPLYSSPEYRKVSLTKIFEKLGATYVRREVSKLAYSQLTSQILRGTLFISKKRSVSHIRHFR